MKYIVVIIGAIYLFYLACTQDELFLWLAPAWCLLCILLASHDQTEEYKILERKDGFGTTYIPVLVQHNTLLWWKWDRHEFVWKEFLSENPNSYTYFEGAKFVIEEYKRFIEKSKVKVEINEKDIG